MRSKRVRIDADQLIRDLQSGSRQALSRAITLVESDLEEHREAGEQMIRELMNYTSRSMRLAITGPPGVGKSSFIEAIGKLALAEGLRIAVIAIDPSSEESKGSILGDKTRMQTLARDERVFIRPAPAGQSIGGIAGHTREVIMMCEAAAYDLIIVETVGVGQSETFARQLTDLFIVLLQPASGDELQAIKKGVVEMADLIVINKADGNLLRNAKEARSFIMQADHISRSKIIGSHGSRSILLSSIHDESMLEDAWSGIKQLNDEFISNGVIEERRKSQKSFWFEKILETRLLMNIKASEIYKAGRKKAREEMTSNSIDPLISARVLADRILKTIKNQ